MGNARSPILLYFGAAIPGVDLSQISIRVDAVRTIFSSALAIYLVCGTCAVHNPGSRTEKSLCRIICKVQCRRPEILHGLNFCVGSGECIGNALYDGISTSEISLDALRKNITNIPQVPELLSDTLRVRSVNVTMPPSTVPPGPRVSSLSRARIRLETATSSGGGSPPVGQRQILALARAIVRRSKLLILDEAESPTERFLWFEIVFIECLFSYFGYRLRDGCGHPELRTDL
ncbi:hypothetical protein BDM02DRAFT_3189262 [Thelephora ganbajun]|uniref:Uncharacterized protein n=1 Tax=Thelephora ganbajun TaxID=370292 RepID=A0ACB6Z9D0_THEGA|nr:hypothetical protein BDM02DRAFT_3189262 [Thelephora ganbajun]